MISEWLFIEAEISISSALFFYGTFLVFSKQEGPLKQSDHFRENADNCALLAEKAPDEPTRNRYERMEAAWRALAEEQDWLDGEVSPPRIGNNGRVRKTTHM